MRVLHLFSNFKWTGPSDPAVSIAAGLRADGVDVVFRSSGYTKGARENSVADKARDRGLEPLTDLHLSKHRSLARDLTDVRRLRTILDEGRFDLVHTHLPNDFRIACRARRGGRPPIVRSLYDTDPDRVSLGHLRRIAKNAAAVIVFGTKMASHLATHGVDPSRIERVDPSIDLARFDPARPLPDLRPRFGFRRDDFLAGIVARVQPQRRFDLLLDAAALLAERCPRFRLLVIGRGSKLDAVGREPARRRRLLDRTVFFPGFFAGEHYPAVLRMLDVKLFLVPGTDGTARAVREALASGLPVVSTGRGILPDLVRHGETGYVVEERAEAFADALETLHGDPDACREMGRRAREDACERFDPRRQVAAVRRIYLRVAGSRIDAGGASSRAATA